MRNSLKQRQHLRDNNIDINAKRTFNRSRRKIQYSRQTDAQTCLKTMFKHSLLSGDASLHCYRLEMSLCRHSNSFIKEELMKHELKEQ